MNKQAFQHKHSLGQNFLSDETLLEQLVNASSVGAEDSVLEIGPGAGDMTKILARRVRRVLALEIDDRLLPILRVALEKEKNVTVVQGDVMRVNLPELVKPLGPFHVVANLPYYLTTPLLTMLLSSALPILSMNLMLQREAAEKLIATPRDDGYGPLSIAAQWRYDPQIEFSVPARMFTPPPKVDSAFIVMPKRDCPPAETADEALFFKVVSVAFAMRRKTLVNNLLNVFPLSREQALEALNASGLSATVRGEELDIKQMAALTDALRNFFN